MNDVASAGFLSTFAWKKLRLLALELHGGKCQCCGATPSLGAVLNVDHIKPRKTHPHLALEISNLQVLCADCNHGKGNWNTHDWRPQRGYLTRGRNRIAHLWSGTDTFCRMWSTGGIAKTREGWEVKEDLGERRICSQCMNCRSTP